MKSLKNNFFQTVKILVLALIIGVGVNYAFAVSWTPPTESPTGGNTKAPVNVSGTAQEKTGGLIVASGSGVNPGLIVGNGNVGIGILSPTKKLDVSGGVKGTEFCLPGSSPTGGCRSTWPGVPSCRAESTAIQSPSSPTSNAKYAVCASGEILMGGGGNCSPGDGTFMESSIPVHVVGSSVSSPSETPGNANGWQLWCKSGAVAQPYAICCTF